eukprot:GFUD01022298.1.p1 GENE.GFUD01022298.1~~GFUD01022298.1.p1  ORF type:complete len:537 (+),score=157.93 GFUD01022298.1:57-1613(+)
MSESEEKPIGSAASTDESKKDSVCSICSVATVSRCQRCLSIVYCGKECQTKGWTGVNGHKKICSQIKNAKKKVEEEAEKLTRYKRTGKNKEQMMQKKAKEVENLFETSVGQFGDIEDCHIYCESKKDLALALGQCGKQNKSNVAIEMALGHIFELLKLTGGWGDQIIGITPFVPSMLILLKKEQEAYNFIKWWINFGETSVDEVQSTDFFNLKNQKIVENLKWEELSLQELVDICLVKIKIRAKLKEEIGSKKTIKSLDKQIQIILSLVKESNELLWKYIADPEEMNVMLLKELEKDPMVFTSPKGDMKEFLSVKESIYYCWEDVCVREIVGKYVGTKETLKEGCINSGWTETMNGSSLGGKKYSYFVDCYRLRLDDDYTWGGGNLHGLYDDPSPGNISKDFMVFCALAARRKMIPMIWDWNRFLQEASLKLNFAYEKSDAKEDWGMLGPMMMRETAGKVYGGTGGGGGFNLFQIDSDGQGLVEAVEEEVENESDGIFKDVGGMENWIQLIEELDNKK